MGAQSLSPQHDESSLAGTRLVDPSLDSDALGFLALALRGAPFKIRRGTLEHVLNCKAASLSAMILAGDLPRPHAKGTPGAFWWSHEIEPALARMAGQHPSP